MIDSNDNDIPKSFSHYETLRVIGKGSSAIVVLARSYKTHDLHACKIIPRKILTTKETIQQIETECRIVEQLSHPGICKIEEVVYLPQQIVIIMEYCPNFSIHELIQSSGALSSHEANRFLLLIINTLVYLHSKNIAHRDLKLDNIVLSSNYEPKLIDFGLSYKPIDNAHEILCSNLCGTLEYLAPEVLYGGIYDGKKYDIWSLGICYYVMLTGSFPWKGNSDNNIMEQIIKCQFTIDTKLPKESRFILQKMLNKDPNERPSAAELENICIDLFKLKSQFSEGTTTSPDMPKYTSHSLRNVNILLNRKRPTPLGKFHSSKY